MPGPEVVEAPGALAVLAEAAALLITLLGWAVVLGLAYTWNATFHNIFQGIAKALTFRISAKWGPGKTIHLGGWAKSLDHAVQEMFTSWAKDQEEAVGMWWYAIGWTVNEMVITAQESAGASARVARWIVRVYTPARIHADTNPLKKKTNQIAAAVGLSALALKNLKKSTHAHEQSQAHTNATTKAAVHEVERTATDAHSRVATVEHAAAHQHAVITSVVDVASLPVPFGRTIAQIKKRVGLLEAGVGATAVAVAMANVFGVPNPRCLSKGPLGRFARTICGIPTSLLNDFLGLLADFFILENICTVLPWLETAASEIGTPLVAGLSEVGAGLCKGSKAPGALRGPKPSVPALIFGVSASGV